MYHLSLANSCIRWFNSQGRRWLHPWGTIFFHSFALQTQSSWCYHRKAYIGSTVLISIVLTSLSAFSTDRWNFVHLSKLFYENALSRQTPSKRDTSHNHRCFWTNFIKLFTFPSCMNLLNSTYLLSKIFGLNLNKSGVGGYLSKSLINMHASP